MKRIQAYTEQRGASLSKHAFLTTLQPRSDDAKQLLWFAPHLAFWVMSFQDLIRINAECIHDEALAEIASAHSREDVGHDIWYLRDIKRLGYSLDLPWVYSDVCRAVRDAAYTIMAAALHADSDYSRLALLLAIEGAAHAGLGRVHTVLEEAGHAAAFEYFGDNHIQAEQDHELFASEGQSKLLAVEIPADAFTGAQATVDSVFDAFNSLLDGLVEIQQRELAQQLRA